MRLFVFLQAFLPALALAQPAVNLGNASGSNGAVATISITLVKNAAAVVATANDVVFESADFTVSGCRIPAALAVAPVNLQLAGPQLLCTVTETACSSDAGCAAPQRCNRMRVGAYTLTNTVLPDGEVLACDFLIGSDAPAGAYDLTNRPSAADVDGDIAGTGGTNGSIMVVRAATPTPSRTLSPQATASRSPTSTRTPTASASATPSPTPTATSFNTPTATAVVPRAHVDLRDAKGVPGGSVSVAVVLTKNGTAVEATSNDITFDPGVFTLSDCSLDRAIAGVPISQQLAGPQLLCTNTTVACSSDAQCPAAQRCNRLRVGTFNFGHAVLPDGVILRCTFQIAPQAAFGPFVIGNRPGAADANGDLDGVTGRDATLTVTLQLCAGDCDGDGEVTVDEIVLLVNIDLGPGDISLCHAGDSNGDGAITVDEIQAAVVRALGGCPP